MAHPAVRAVIPNCCTGAGQLLTLNASTLELQNFVTTGANSNSQSGDVEFLTLFNGGKSAAVLSNVTTTSPDQATVLTVVDLVTGTASAALTIPNSCACGFAVNPKSGLIYVSYEDSDGNTRLQVVNPVSLTVIADVNLGPIGLVTINVSPDGGRIYVGTAYGTSIVFEAAGVVPVGTIASSAFAFSPDSSIVYSYSFGIASYGAIEFVNASTLQVTQTVPFNETFEAAAISPDGSQLYIAGDSLAWTLNIATLALSSTTPPFSVSQVVTAPNGKVFFGSSLYEEVGQDSQVAAFDPVSSTFTATAILPGAGPIATSPSKAIFMPAD